MINPGIPKKNQVAMESPSRNKKGYKYCHKCKMLMNLDENTKHCEDCNVCIVGNIILYN
jgi:hypothetical protein